MVKETQNTEYGEDKELTESKLDTLIEKYEENRWIDCAWDDLDDEKEFETIMKYLKENKILKEIIKDNVQGTEDPDYLQTMINN